jgi:hypothetical protein
MIAQIESGRYPVVLVENDLKEELESGASVLVTRVLYTVTALSGVLFVADTLYLAFRLCSGH